MKKKGCRPWVVMIIVLSFFLFTGTVSAAEKVVKLGLVLPLTGQAAPVGEFVKMGNELAVEEINAAGGIKSLGGAKLQLIIADHQMKPEVGIAQAERLVKEEKVAALLGGYMSAVIYTSSQVGEKYKVPFIVQGGTSNNICERGFKYVFRAIPNSTVYALDILHPLKDISKGTSREVKRIGLTYEMTSYGKSNAEAIRGGVAPLGMEIVADLPYPPQTTDFSLSVSKLKAANPDAVICVPYVTDAVMLVKTMKEMDFNTGGVIGTGGFLDPTFTEMLGKMADYIFQVAYMSENMKLPSAIKFHQNMMKKYGKPATGDAAYSYTGMYILRDAIEKAGSLEGTKIRDALASLDEPHPPWAICSITGVKFDEKGENIYARLCTSQYLKGQWWTVWKPEVAKTTAVWPVPKWSERK